MEEEPLKRMRFPFIATVSYIKPFKQKGYETKLKTPYIYIGVRNKCCQDLGSNQENDMFSPRMSYSLCKDRNKKRAVQLGLGQLWETLQTQHQPRFNLGESRQSHDQV